MFGQGDPSSSEMGRFWKSVLSGVAKRVFGAQTPASARDIRLVSQETQLDVYNELNGLWKYVPYDELPVTLDVPRLVRRITVVDIDGQVLFPPFGPLEDNSLKRTVELVKDCVLAIVKITEGNDRYQEVCQKLSADAFQVSDDRYSKTGGTADLYVEDILKEIGNEQTSACLRILKTINQSFISHCAFQLKKNMQILTKDVRGPDGWTIKVAKTTNGILVKHCRKEQSIDFNERNHWTLQWDVLMSFDESVDNMVEAKLGLVELHLDAGMDKSFAKSVEREVRNLIRT